MTQAALPLMVSFPFGYAGAPLAQAQTLVDLASYAVVKMAEGDVKGLVRLMEGAGIPVVLRVPAIFQLGVGYGLAHGLPLPEVDFFRLIDRLLAQQFPAFGKTGPAIFRKEEVLQRLRQVAIPVSERT
jgi:hypothetical protein